MAEIIPTKERLARALEELKDPNLMLIIGLARQGKYDDYQSDLENPQQALINTMREFGHSDYISRIYQGEFDATFAEGKVWADQVRRDDPEIDEILTAFGEPNDAT